MLFSRFSKSLFLLGYFFLTAVSSLSAQNFESPSPSEVGLSEERLSRLDQVFTDYVTDQKMAGSVILVARRDKIAYYKSFGFRDVESKSKMQKDAIFRIASQTKAIVSVGIMILQEEGKLLIQDPAGKFIPEFNETTVAVPNENGGYEVVPARRKITIRDLLTHTSGLGYGNGQAKELWAEAEMQGWYFAHRNEPILETVKRMASLPMDTQPGEKWIYGYSIDVLGAIIEVASGMPLDEFLKTKIFDPLGMKDTHFYLPKEKKNRLATVYNPKDGQPLKRAPQEGTMNSQGHYVDGPRKSFSGGAGLLSTAKDYYLFLQMMENKGELNGARILAPSTVHLMTINHLNPDLWFRAGEGFGLGFDVVVDEGRRGFPGSVGQFGWGGAYGSTYWVDPLQELVVVYMTQLRPGSIVRDQLELRALIYQAMVD